MFWKEIALEKSIKTVHEILFVSDKITIGGDNCIIESALLFGNATQSFAEFQYKKDANSMNYCMVDLTSRKVNSFFVDQHKALGEIEKLIKNRLMNANIPSRHIYKEKLGNDCFENAIQTLNGCDYFDGNVTFFVDKYKCELLNYCILASSNGDGLVVYVANDEQIKTVLSLSLYTQCKFKLELDNDIAIYKGIIVRAEALENGFLLYVQPYPMEIFQSTQISGLACEKGTNPFIIMDFMINNADSDVIGFNYPGSENKRYDDYLIVGVIKNLQVNIEDFVIGTVRFGMGINTSDSFVNEYTKISDDKTMIWVNVKENSLYKAFTKGKQMLNSACDFITLALKNDEYIDWYGTEELEKNVWDLKSHIPEIYIDSLFYIENCSTGDALTLKNDNILAPSSVQLDEHVGGLFDKGWIEAFFGKIQDSDEKILRLKHAINWIVQAWRATDKYDRLIYCSTALEFIVNGEKGNNIFNEYALKDSREPFSKKEKNKYISDIIDKIRIDTIDGLSEESIDDLNNSIEKMVRSKLSESSFNSKLDMLIKRLEIPVSDEEKKLLGDARAARNKLVHGLEMCSISTLEVKKLCGVTSRILVYKIIEKTKEQ